MGSDPDQPLAWTYKHNHEGPPTRAWAVKGPCMPMVTVGGSLDKNHSLSAPLMISDVCGFVVKMMRFLVVNLLAISAIV